MVAAIGAAAAIGGGLISANASRSAANTQAAAADRAAQLQAEQSAQMRSDLAPWTSSGSAAQSRLNQLLGIGGGGNGGGRFYTEAELRQMLTPQFTTYSGPGYTAQGAPGVDLSKTYQNPTDLLNQLGRDGAYQYTMQKYANDPGMRTAYLTALGMPGGNSLEYGGGPNGELRVNSGGTDSAQGLSGTLDTAGLDAEVAKRLAAQQQAQQAYESDPAFGSLLRAYRNGEDFSFTGQDLQNDPGYQFGLTQGTQGIERGQASRGNFLSGAAMKELARYNEDYAGTKFNDAFNRNLNTWNTNLNAYNDNRNRIYNFLNGTSSLGENAAARVGNNSQQVANNVGNALMGGANANAAGTVGTANALTSGINQAYNNYASQNPNTASGWNNLLAGQGGGYSGYTGYVGNNDPIANLNTTKGWTG